MLSTSIALLSTIKNIALGLSPLLPGESHFGVHSATSAELTAALANGVPDARIEKIDVELDSNGTTDRARLKLLWNTAGNDAGLPSTAFVKGTPSTVSSRILNAAFGLCESEVRFYNELYGAVSNLTLKPYLARVGAGGRFVIVLEEIGKDTRFFQPGEEASLTHAEGIMDALAELHSRYWRSPKFSNELAWITPYNRRPGYPLANKVVASCEKWLKARDDVPPSVLRLTQFHLQHWRELDKVWASLPPTLCHGDSHLANTYARSDGTSGLFDWQNIHKTGGMRDVAYFFGHSLTPELRRAEEKNLIARYIEGLAKGGVKEDLPTLDEAYEQYRYMILDCWTSVWASLAIGGMAEEERGEILMKRLYAVLEDLDTEQALGDAVKRLGQHPKPF
jgi:hypothetical protein